MTAWRARITRALRASFVDPVARDHTETDAQFRRRRIIVAVALVIGAVVLGISLAARPGDVVFYPLTLLVALVWTAGGLLSGHLHLGYLPVRGALRRPVLNGFLTGLTAGLVFLAGGLVVRQLPPLHAEVEQVLAHARHGSLSLVAVVTVLNGIAEEIFFRGGLYAAIGRRHAVTVSTLVYALATIATFNPMLIFAALTLGAVLALQRRASGGLLAPVITHVTWSTIMLFLLPPLFT
jgi:membrane protease YdiL (CAAX protease family)